MGEGRIAQKRKYGAGFWLTLATGAGLARDGAGQPASASGWCIEEPCTVMVFAIGPALGALSSVSSLLESAASGIGQAASNELSALGQYFSSSNDQTQSKPASGGASSPLDSSTLAALISLQGQGTAGTGGASGLFAKLDADGDGAVSKSEFESALGQAGVDSASADALFGKLDANGDGSISKGELAPARSGSSRHHHSVGGGSGGGASSSSNSTSADGSTTQTTTNADGSSTTTITYADGSTVTSTTPAASGGGSSGGTGNLIEKLIQMQSMLIGQSTPTTAVVA